MKERVLSVSYCIYRKNKIVPLIRISGERLNKAGFNVSDNLVVCQNHLDELIIKKLKKT